MNAGTAAAPKKKILVVDDNEVVLKTVSLKLQGCGYQILTALDGTQAVAAARKETPDLILLDISFPPDVEGVPWDGFRIMDWFRRLDPAKRIPIIIITGLEDEQNKERATASGAVAFFHKPINHDDLLKVVRATLEGLGQPA
ncbi:MAG: response regulator [Verrucomicrobiia bacterium]|jgi:CheY-like chemotaxis protein